MLTGTQKEIAEMYFGENLTISEIALERNVSRQSVSDAVAQVKRELDHYEELLHKASQSEAIVNLTYELEGKNQEIGAKIRKILGVE